MCLPSLTERLLPPFLRLTKKATGEVDTVSNFAVAHVLILTIALYDCSFSTIRAQFTAMVRNAAIALPSAVKAKP